MTCNSTTIYATVVDQSTVKIVKGMDTYVVAQVLKKDEGRPYAIQSFSAATGLFRKDDNSALAVSGSLVSADLGTIRFDLGQADTAQLLTGEDLGFEMYLQDSRGLSIFQVEEKLNISDSLFDS